MSTPFKPIAIPGGVVATATKKMRSSNWAEVNLVRWREGQMSPVGGQAQYDFSFASRCKAVHGWHSLDSIYHTAYLCEQHLYVDTGGVLSDITPAGGLVPPTPLGAGGYSDGDYGVGDELAATAAFTTASPNITMVANSGWIVPGMHVFDVTINPANPPLVGVVSTYIGAALVLTANAAVASAGASDMLMFGGYGEPRAINSIAAMDKVPDAWSLGNFGSILLAMTSPDGRLLHWDPAAGGLATLITPASGSTVPHGRCFVVTPERFVVVFAATHDGTPDNGSFRRFCWCNQEDFTNWAYMDVTSQAGFLDIEPSSPIVAAEATRQGTLFWTAKKAYRSRFLGLPYVYNYEELADNCTPWSPQSVVTTSSMALWMSEQGLFSFDGTSIIPGGCEVRPWVDDDIDLLQVREQSCAVHVNDFNEFWWFFPQDGKTTNTRAIIYNYKEGWWSQARMSRSAGVAGAYNAHTIMADGMLAFEHEASPVYAHADLPWAETFDLNLMGGGGGKLTTVKQLLPDIEGDISNVRYSLYYRNSRSLGTGEQYTPPVPVRPDGYVDLRTTGRDIRLRFSIAGPQVLMLTVGAHLIDCVPRGDR